MVSESRPRLGDLKVHYYILAYHLRFLYGSVASGTTEIRAQMHSIWPTKNVSGNCGKCGKSKTAGGKGALILLGWDGDDRWHARGRHRRLRRRRAGRGDAAGGRR